jgi:hypothetical protein
LLLLAFVEALLEVLLVAVMLSAEDDVKELKVLRRFNSTFEVECGVVTKELNRFMFVG